MNEEKNSRQKNAKQSERYSFIAEHRGGPLKKEDHRRLIGWAAECARHVLHLTGGETDARLVQVLQIANEWADGRCSAGEAMKASLAAHAVARETPDPVLKAIARAVGQAVATAHMADHSLGGAFYALKAVKLASGDVDKEREWQNALLKKLPTELVAIVTDSWNKKELDRRL